VSIGTLMDRTTATRRRPAAGSGIDRSTGKFTDDTDTGITIKIHVSRPKGDETLPGGAHVETGDCIVHLDQALDVKLNDILTFWGRDYEVKYELRPQYDTLNAVVAYKRRKLLLRELRPSN